MTQDEIIRMAREAGFVFPETQEDSFTCWWEELERFAALVAANEAEKWKAENKRDYENWKRAAEKAAECEREACAKVCEELINEETCYVWIPDAMGAVNNCAAAIRARGENK